MATKEPKVIRGSHSVRTEYPDGRVEFESNWEELVNDVNAALKEYAEGKGKSVPAKKTSRIVKEMKETLADATKSLAKKPAKKTTKKTK